MKKDALRELRDKKMNGRKRKRAKSEVGRRKSSVRRASLTGLTAPETVTYEMKQEMSEMISRLPEKKMLHVVNIIQESMPQLKNSGQDEIELDIDQLDLNTQLKLYNYVVRKDDSSRRASGKPKGAGSGIKKKKRKAMTEDEQSRQIEEIQKKIRQFDRVSGGGANDSDESSSEDENDNQAGGNMSSDDSSSEEE
jgi:bromodomain-containing factor 1